MSPRSRWVIRSWATGLAVAFLWVFATAVRPPGVHAQQQQPPDLTRTQPASQPAQEPALQEDQHRAWAKDAKPAGSPSCEKCHYEQYQRWKDSAHAAMVRVPSAESVEGDFTRDNVLRYKGYTYKMSTRDGKYFVTEVNPAGTETTYQIDLVLGSMRMQAYLTKLPDGRYYIVPAYWHIIRRGWFDSALITPLTKEGIGVKQYWNINCLSCHATDLKVTFDVKTAQYSTTMLEPGVGCEDCHNPGSTHNEFFEKKPLRDYVRGELNDTFISNQRFFDKVKSVELCASCHAIKNNYFTGYWPGDETADYFSPIIMTFHGADPQGDWFADGRPTRFGHYMEFMGSRCFNEGNATCISCHEGHSSQNDSLLIAPLEQSNALCLNCHQEKYGGAKLVQHTFHLPDSPGSRCYACHMAESLERIMMHRRDHSMDNPLPENTIKYGIPNSCNNRDCHADKTPEWAVRTLDQWYGPQKRRNVLYATEAMWRARTGDVAVIPQLLRMTKDTNLRILQRASAAAGLGIYFGPKAQAAVPGLIELLAEENIVFKRPFQIAVAQSLGYIGDRQGVEPLTKLLDSPYRLVRLTSAYSLINLGVIQMEGENGQRLERAKLEYVQSLKNWPDVPEFRVNLGNYYVVHKNYRDAMPEYQAAIRLNADLPDAYYWEGRAWALQGKFKEAIESWRKVRDLRPGYQDVDRLITAAEKELKGQQ